MRTLIVDNVDSFTLNLASYVEEVSGSAPTVLRHDDPALTAEAASRFDAVIISPGPGRPDNPHDIGMSSDVVANAGVPVLGVCLGHQLIGHLHGARVTHAPRPVHGLVSTIQHDGSGLFEGIPELFDVVRYHSLIIDELPDSLRVTASTDCGLVMAIQHTTLPQWGVQFHPESIGGQFGHLIIANFLRLAQQWNTRHEVTGRIVDLTVDPAAVYSEFYSGSSASFWLDDAAGTSYLGDGEVLSHRVGHANTIFELLDAHLQAHRVAPGTGFQLGLVGYLGYEIKAECGGAAAHTAEHPDAQFIFARRAIAVERRRVRLMSLGEDDGWFDEVERRLMSLTSPSTPPALPPLELDLLHDREDYLDLIRRAQELITDGETYEVCLTTSLTGHGDFDPFPAYLKLRAQNPSPYGAFLRFGDLAVLSTSPERFLRIDARGHIESRPIKGTRPRAEDPDTDAVIARQLASDRKDRAENLMIVDLVRHDLAHVAAPGSVEVPELFKVETYATVHQLVSSVTAQLGADYRPVDAVRAAFPGGSMTGAPKIRTMEIIDDLEGRARGIYSGALGYFSLDGSVDLSMVIRTIIAHRTNSGDQVSYGVGGAILALSEPEAEWDETRVKARPILRLVGE